MHQQDYSVRSLPNDGLFWGLGAQKPTTPAGLRLLQDLVSFVKKVIKGTLLFLSILPIVTIVAAIVGCLALPNGDIAFLGNPEKLFDFAFNVRAGLKVNIVVVSFLIFFFFVNDGILSRRWV